MYSHSILLQDVILANDTRLTDKTLFALMDLKLAYLDLSSVTKLDCDVLCKLIEEQSQDLEVLYLSFTKSGNVSDKVVESISRCFWLKKLYLSRQSQIREKSIIKCVRYY